MGANWDVVKSDVVGVSEFVSRRSIRSFVVGNWGAPDVCS